LTGHPLNKKTKLFQAYKTKNAVGMLHALFFRIKGDLRMRKSSKGFTLVELMIVAAIIGIMALVAAPNLVNGLPTYRIKSAVRDCTSQLRSARSRAIKEKSNVTVSFDADKHIMTIDGRKFPLNKSFTQKYGSGVAFGIGEATKGVDGETLPNDGVGFSENDFTFTSRGLADFGAGDMNGAAYFTNNRGDAYAVTVNAAGAVAIRRWRGSAWGR
jgi:prepilin-type N-terminal cleavage/methylation domain-containing protein